MTTTREMFRPILATCTILSVTFMFCLTWGQIAMEEQQTERLRIRSQNELQSRAIDAQLDLSKLLNDIRKTKQQSLDLEHL